MSDSEQAVDTETSRTENGGVAADVTIDLEELLDEGDEDERE